MTNPTDREAVERLADALCRRCTCHGEAFCGAELGCLMDRKVANTLRDLLACVEAAEARADIDQSAYEELLRAMPEDPPLPPDPPDPNDEYIERIRELEAEVSALRETPPLCSIEQLMNALQKANDEEDTFFSGFIMNDIGYDGVILDGRWNLVRVVEILNEGDT